MVSILSIENLSWINYILSGIHLIASVVLLGLALYYRNTEFRFDYLRGERTYNVSGMHLVYLAVAFLFITACFHLFYARSTYYQNSVRKGYQHIRWLEYGITATIMGFIVAVISGVRDIYLISVLTLIVFAIMTTGYFFEIFFNKYKRAWIPLLIGFVLLAVYATVVFLVYRDEASKVEDLPWWVTWIVIGTLIAFGIFGIVPLIQYVAPKLGFKWKYLWSEYGYMILSATAKLFLGGLLGYGILRRPADE